MLEVIEHVETAEDLLTELHRVLAPGGLLIVSTPNMASLRDRMRALLGRERRGEGYHCRFFTVASLSDLLRNAGFDVLETWATMPWYGINRVTRVGLGSEQRFHVRVRGPLRTLLGETVFMLARRRALA
jgi:SAM-dependent methyltransferase